ncbi:MAG: flavodoxin family protein [Thermoplasmata archaeon]
MAMRVLGMLGSPCVRGNTADLLDAVLEGARQKDAIVERFDLARMNIHPCRECRACDQGAVCAYEDDDMRMIYAKIREVDAIALASPIFFMSVTAQTKAMIDRCQCFWVERFVLKRRHYEGRRRPKGLFVSCAGGPKTVTFEPAIHVAKAFFSAIDYDYIGEVLLSNTDDPDVGARKEDAMENARAAGKQLCS